MPKTKPLAAFSGTPPLQGGETAKPLLSPLKRGTAAKRQGVAHTPRCEINGFSLLELMIALTVTLTISMIGFELFRQNERAFQDQYLISEMQQTARSVTFQISEEIRQAGQGVPTYAASFDALNNEWSAVIVNGSDATHLHFRAGESDVETTVSTAPVDYSLNVSRSIFVADASVFSNALGTTSPVGRYVYIGGIAANGCWGWVRAQLNSILVATNTLTLIPRDAGDGCQNVAGTVTPIQPQAARLEECISIYLNAGSVWRTTASDMTAETNPTWATASELGRSFSSLTFAYYDNQDAPVTPNTLASRLAVARIDVTAVVQTASPLSNGTVLSTTFTVRSIPVNVRIH